MRRLVLVEVLLSFGVLCGILWLFVNALDTYWCIGACDNTPDGDHIWRFRVLAAGTAVAVVGTFATAWHRRARWSWMWHILVGVAAVVAIAAFAVPQLDLRDLDNRPVSPSHPQCMSPGPDCDKLGG
jgi:hypothetical protein